MQIVLDGVAVQGRRDPMLAPFDLTWRTGEAVLVAAEPGHGHTALALAATGRLVPSSGTVTLEDAPPTDPPLSLSDVTAVVDVPGVSEPVESIPVRTHVAEDLALARRRTLPRDVAGWIAAHGLDDVAGLRVDQLDALTRTRMLVALAAERADVHFLVLTLPDRHGGAPAGWWGVACDAAAAGYGVLVQCSRASARLLGAEIPPDVTVDPRREPPLVALRREFPVAEPEPETRPEEAETDAPAVEEPASAPDADTEVLPPLADEPQPGAPSPDAVPEPDHLDAPSEGADR
jgi:energy-coupling factor transporter ATP-binding protein EcfA2